MGAVNALALACATVAAMATPAPCAAQSVTDWRPLVAAASARFGIPIAWIERVMRAESGGKTMLAGRPVTSRAGAMGLMQLMPATWSAMRSAYRLGPDPYDPHDNIVAGAAYLRAMYDRFGYPGLFAAYNAGPGRYAEYLTSGRPLPGETRAYVAAVAGAGNTVPQQLETPARSRLFALSAAPEPGAAAATSQAPGEGLFVALSPR